MVKNNQLVEKNNFINGYSENLKYTYNDFGQLEMVVYNLKSDEGKLGKNVMKISYNSFGLISKTEYFDKANALLEEKIFEYK